MTLTRKVSRNWNKNAILQACKLYLVTADDWLGGRTLHSCVAEAIAGGVTFVQLRQFNTTTINIAKAARDLAPVCHIANVPLVIDNDIDAAKVAGADGIHIGQENISCHDARNELGQDAIVGVTVTTVEEALAAEKNGATYVSVGPVFSNRWDPNVALIGVDEVAKIKEAVSIPMVAMGGINTSNVSEVAATGVNGIAFCSAILAAKNIEEAAKEMRAEVDKYIVK